MLGAIEGPSREAAAGDRLLDAAACLIAVISAQGEVVRSNRAFALMPPEERERARAALVELAREGTSGPAELRMGDGRLVSWTIAALPAPDGAPTHAVGTGIDVTETRRDQAELLDSLQEVVFRTDPEGRFTFLNGHWTEMTGRPVPESLGRLYLDFVHPGDREASALRYARLIDGERRMARTTLRYLHENGALLWVEVNIKSILDEAGQAIGTSGTITDVTERHELEERLRYLADHDALTGLINRRRFEEELERHRAHGRRYGMAGALLVLDLDGFKAINDTHGHRAGDRVLVSVAGVLKGRLRETDVVARLGGDEFAVLLPHAQPAEAEQVCQALELALPDEVAAPGGHRIEASIGFAPFTDAMTSIDSVLSAADASMYRVKAGQARNYRRLRRIE